nr:MAG TPA: hypothetical protein [Caudoviricetes sp.]
MDTIEPVAFYSVFYCVTTEYFVLCSVFLLFADDIDIRRQYVCRY